MSTVRIKPAGKLYVRFPDNGHRHLAQDGEEVTLDSWWHRRIADKDVVIVEPKEPSKESK